MLTLEEYIKQQKKKDKLDEFDFSKHSENMAAAIGYVTSFFNEYLNPESYGNGYPASSWKMPGALLYCFVRGAGSLLPGVSSWKQILLTVCRIFGIV